MSPNRHSLTRRNGQPQACEMCRKAKIRCDHGTPVCGRCARRSLICTYHPAPLTKTTRETGFEPARSLSIVSPKLSMVYPTPSSYSTPNESPQSSLEGQQAKTPLFHKSSNAYYGNTHFSAIFSENQASLGPAMREVADDGQFKETSTPVFGPNERHYVPTEAQLKLGINTLLYFPTLRTCENLLESFSNTIDVWLSPTMIRHCLAQVWSEYGEHLSHPRSIAKLSEMASDLCNNGKNPIHMDSHWVNWFGGSQLRWEMLSILFSFFGRGFKQREEWDPVFNLPEQEGSDRRTAAARMATCADSCLKIDEDPETNDIVVCALKNYWRLKSVIDSDQSDGLLTGSGMVISAFITAGLHRLPRTEETTPLSEYRSMLASSLYYMDKCSSLFAGRPPLLIRQYCHCPLPLDLSEDELYNGPEVLAIAKSKLDQAGWNMSGSIHATTWFRALSLQTDIKERILELSLGVNVHCTETTIRDLVAQLDDIVASYPPHIQYQSLQGSRNLTGGRTGQDLYVVTRIHLDVLECRFLIQRLNVSRCHASGQALFDIAQELMTTVLSFWLNRDPLQSFNNAFNWIAVCYGIPSAGLLCVELLRFIKATPEGSPTPLKISRSEVIQSLTIFIAFLNWVRPTDGNAELCWKLGKVIKRIVDNVLDSSPPNSQPQLPPSHAVLNSVGNGNTTAVDLTLMEITDWDDLNWLNTIDWTQGDWLDTNQQFL